MKNRVCALLVGIAPAIAAAQSEISGELKPVGWLREDQQLIKGVKVFLTDSAGKRRYYNTKGDGKYLFKNVTPGPVTVTFRKYSKTAEYRFRRPTHSGELGKDQKLPFDVTLISREGETTEARKRYGRRFADWLTPLLAPYRSSSKKQEFARQSVLSTSSFALSPETKRYIIEELEHRGILRTAEHPELAAYLRPSVEDIRKIEAKLQFVMLEGDVGQLTITNANHPVIKDSLIRVLSDFTYHGEKVAMFHETLRDKANIDTHELAKLEHRRFQRLPSNVKAAQEP